MFFNKSGIVTLAALLLAGYASQAQAVLFVTTDQAGAQVQVDVNHTQSWTFTAPADIDDVVGGLFTMKRGSQSSASVTFDIIQGVLADFGSVAPLLSVTLGPSDFTQQFNGIGFQGAPISLDSGVTYTGVLHSLAADAQNQAYFIKSSSTLIFLDDNGQEVTFGGSEITPGGADFLTAAANPEPAAASLLALGLIGLAGRATSRRRRKPAEAHSA